MSNKIKRTPKIPIILFINGHLKKKSVSITNNYAFLTIQNVFFSIVDIFFSKLTLLKRKISIQSFNWIKLVIMTKIHHFLQKNKNTVAILVNLKAIFFKVEMKLLHYYSIIKEVYFLNKIKDL